MSLCWLICFVVPNQWRIQGGRIGRGPPPPLFSADLCFLADFFFIFGRGIEEFGFPGPPFHNSWIRHC